MANHRYTSLTDILDSPQNRAPLASHDSGYNSDVDHSFPTEMFGELCFLERSTQTSSSSSSVWDLFNPPLPPRRPLPTPRVQEGMNQNLVQGLNGGAVDPVAGLENQNKAVEGPVNLLVYHEFDEEKTGFARKMIFLPHKITAASSSAGAGASLRMRRPRDFAAAAADEEQEKEKSSDEAEEKGTANGVKPGNRPQV